MTTAILAPPTGDRNPPADEIPHTPLDRSLEQRMDALATANRVRTLRARLKRDIKAGRKQPRELVLSPPWYADTMKVWDLLLAIPRCGTVKVNRKLIHCRISPSKTLGGLSERQRVEIAATL